MFYKHTSPQRQKGFTLIEIIVSIGLLGIVAIIATGALVAATDAYRKSVTTRTALDNLNITIESMLREMRTGTNFHCNPGFITATNFDTAIHTLNPALVTGNDCSGDSIAFRAPGGGVVFYGQDGDSIVKARQFISSENIARYNNTVYGRLSDPKMEILDLNFAVEGSSDTDDKQPHIVIFVKGFVEGNRSDTTFEIQTTLSQRALE